MIAVFLILDCSCIANRLLARSSVLLFYILIIPKLLSGLV